MWPRFNSKKPTLNRVDSLSSLRESAGDLSFLEKNNTHIRVWVPSLVGEAIKDTASYQGETMAFYLRNILFRHCYGQYILNQKEQEDLRLKQYTEPILAKYHEYIPIKDPVYWVPQLGKNIFPIKLALPSKTQRDLQKLADHHSINLSQYLRETIVSHVFGHGMVPSRRYNDLEEQEINTADAWVEDDDFELLERAPISHNGKSFYFEEE